MYIDCISETRIMENVLDVHQMRFQNAFHFVPYYPQLKEHLKRLIDAHQAFQWNCFVPFQMRISDHMVPSGH